MKITQLHYFYFLILRVKLISVNRSTELFVKGTVNRISIVCPYLWCNQKSSFVSWGIDSFLLIEQSTFSVILVHVFWEFSKAFVIFISCSTRTYQITKIAVCVLVYKMDYLMETVLCLIAYYLIPRAARFLKTKCQL